MADCCVVPSGVMFSGRYGFYLFVSIFGWLCILVIYLGYLFVLHKKINKIKSFDSRIAVSVKVNTFKINFQGRSQKKKYD